MKKLMKFLLTIYIILFPSLSWSSEIFENLQFFLRIIMNDEKHQGKLKSTPKTCLKIQKLMKNQKFKN